MSVNIGGNILSASEFTANGEITDPNVVTNGLVLWIDAGNFSSYNGSTSYYNCGYGCQYYASDPGCSNCNGKVLDMSGNGNDGTIVSAASVSYSDSGANLLFGSSSDRVTFSSIQSFGYNTTWNVWVRCHSNVSTYNMFMGGVLPYFGFYGGNSAYFSNTVNGTQVTVQSSTSYSLNTWYNLTFTTSYIGGNTIMSIYVDGVLDGTNTFTGAQSSSAATFCLGDGQTSNWYRFDGDIGPVMIYNRTLYIDEIVQNHWAIRPRYYSIIAPTPSNTPANSPPVSPTPTPSVTPTRTPSVTPTRTPSVTPTITPTVSPTRTPTVTPTPSVTRTPTPTPTPTPSSLPITFLIDNMNATNMIVDIKVGSTSITASPDFPYYPSDWGSAELWTASGTYDMTVYVQGTGSGYVTITDSNGSNTCHEFSGTDDILFTSIYLGRPNAVGITMDDGLCS